MLKFYLGQVDFVEAITLCSVIIFLLTLLLILLLGLYMNLKILLLRKKKVSGRLDAIPESSDKITAFCEILRKYVGNLETSEEDHD